MAWYDVTNESPVLMRWFSHALGFLSVRMAQHQLSVVWDIIGDVALRASVVSGSTDVEKIPLETALRECVSRHG